MRKKLKVPLYIKEYEQTLPSHKEYIENEFMTAGDGFANIDINTDADTEWYNPLSYGIQKEVNGDIYDYIDKKAFCIPVTNPIKITFHGCTLEEEECQKVESIIREHYTQSLWEALNNLRNNISIAVGLALLGALMLVIAFTLQTVQTDLVISEMAMIVATFTFWEAADYAMIKRSELKIQRLYAGQLAIAVMEFVREGE